MHVRCIILLNPTNYHTVVIYAASQPSPVNNWTINVAQWIDIACLQRYSERYIAVAVTETHLNFSSPFSTATSSSSSFSLVSSDATGQVLMSLLYTIQLSINQIPEVTRPYQTRKQTPVCDRLDTPGQTRNAGFCSQLSSRLPLIKDRRGIHRLESTGPHRCLLDIAHRVRPVQRFRVPLGRYQCSGVEDARVRN